MLDATNDEKFFFNKKIKFVFQLKLMAILKLIGFERNIIIFSRIAFETCYLPFRSLFHSQQ